MRALGECTELLGSLEAKPLAAVGRWLSIVTHFSFILAQDSIDWFIPALPGNPILCSASILRRIHCIFRTQQAVVQNSALTTESQLAAASPHCRGNPSECLSNLTFSSLRSRPVPSSVLTSPKIPPLARSTFAFCFIPFRWIYFTCCCFVSYSITTHLTLFF